MRIGKIITDITDLDSIDKSKPSSVEINMLSKECIIISDDNTLINTMKSLGFADK